MSRARILLVEDDVKMAFGLRFNLDEEGYEVDVAPTGEDALVFLEKTEYQLVLLDLMLPGEVQGTEVLEQARSRQLTTPIIVVSARDTREDILGGLDLGADDYITKPFDLDLLLAKISSFIRGRRWLNDDMEKLPDRVLFGKCWIDFKTSTASNGRKEFRLTTKEALVMRLLLKKKGQVVSRDEFMREVWGVEQDLQTRTLDTFIHQLRKYFEKNSRTPRYIQKVHGEGYKLMD